MNVTLNLRIVLCVYPFGIEWHLAAEDCGAWEEFDACAVTYKRDCSSICLPNFSGGKILSQQTGCLLIYEYKF
jgi:hypothetical protein